MQWCGNEPWACKWQHLPMSILWAAGRLVPQSTVLWFLLSVVPQDMPFYGIRWLWTLRRKCVNVLALFEMSYPLSDTYYSYDIPVENMFDTLASILGDDTVLNRSTVSTEISTCPTSTGRPSPSALNATTGRCTTNSSMSSTKTRCSSYNTNLNAAVYFGPILLKQTITDQRHHSDTWYIGPWCSGSGHRNHDKAWPQASSAH